MLPSFSAAALSGRPAWKVGAATLRAHTELAPWRSLCLIAALYAAIVVLAGLAVTSGAWSVALAAVVLIAALQHHLLILMHEGAHGLIVRDKALNDWITDLLCAVPLLLVVRNYRHFHLAHHRNAGDAARDPERALYGAQGFFYKRRPPREFLRGLLLDLAGVNFVRMVLRFQRFLAQEHRARRNPWLVPSDVVKYVLVWGCAGALAVHFDVVAELLVFWFLPMGTVLFLLGKLHGYGEHTGQAGPSEFERSIVHDFDPVTNFFFYPIKSGFHLEHHLYPAVPWYRMESLRRHLTAGAAYRAAARGVTLDGYFVGDRTVLRTLLVSREQNR